MESPSAGFTLIELVATLIIVGIMAAVALPRFAARADFDAVGFVEQTRATFRFAQKTAIAKHRPVCVTIAGNAITYTLSTTYNNTSCSATQLLNPAPINGVPTNWPATPSGLTISAASFYFDALGQASAAQSISITGGTATQTVVVEAATGYVH